MNKLLNNLRVIGSVGLGTFLMALGCAIVSGGAVSVVWGASWIGTTCSKFTQMEIFIVAVVAIFVYAIIAAGNGLAQDLGWPSLRDLWNRKDKHK